MVGMAWHGTVARRHGMWNLAASRVDARVSGERSERRERRGGATKTCQSNPGDYKVTYKIMDNDTMEMTCERAEDELSGYLDDVLDLRLRRSVETHLASCDHCQEILADFRRNDEMLKALPFIEPPPNMRDEFFHSPRYLKLTAERARQRNYAKPLTAALVAAAMLVVALGGALLFRQGFFAQQQAQGNGTSSTLGNATGVTPLPAGPRLIYERGGALWSAPEHAVGLPRQLTPSGTTVAGWSVSPSGRMVMYIAAQTGAIHTIRSDGQSDTVVGSVTGGHAPAAGFWTTPTGAALANGFAWSPDNTRVAYVAQNGNTVALHVMNATGAADIVATPISDGTIGQPLWSGDSVYVAYTAHQATGQSVWVLNVTTTDTARVAARSDAAQATATVDRLSWQTASAAATLTWSTRADGVVTGVFRADASMSDSATRLTPKDATYTAADVSAGGAWLLARGATISEIAANQASPQILLTLAHPVTRMSWSPKGQVAAVVSDGALSLLAPDKTPAMLVPVARGLTVASPLAWSADGTALAWQADEGVMSAPIHLNAPGTATLVAAHVTAQALVWAPDGQALAARSATGVLLAPATGGQVSVTDSQATSGGRFAWSLAG